MVLWILSVSNKKDNWKNQATIIKKVEKKKLVKSGKEIKEDKLIENTKVDDSIQNDRSITFKFYTSFFSFWCGVNGMCYIKSFYTIYFRIFKNNPQIVG